MSAIRSTLEPPGARSGSGAPREGASAPSMIPAWLPDFVTLTRVGLIPCFLVAAEATRAGAEGGAPSGALRATTLLLLLVIGASDKLDGYLARRSGRPTTRRGALLDAGADRLVQWSGAWFFALRAGTVFSAPPLWFPLLLVARDAVLLFAWLRAPRLEAVTVEHEIHGKAATVAVFIVLLAAVAGAPTVAVSLLSGAAGGAVIYSTARYVLRTRGTSRAAR